MRGNREAGRASVEKQSVDCYVYQTLPEEVRTVYDEVYDAILYEKKMWR